MYSIFFTSQARRVFKKLPFDVQDKLKTEAAQAAVPGDQRVLEAVLSYAGETDMGTCGRTYERSESFY